MKTVAICFRRRPGGEVLCLLCGSEHYPGDEPLAAIPYQQHECADCGRDVARVAHDCERYWTRTTGELLHERPLTVGNLRAALAGVPDGDAVYIRDQTFDLTRALSVIGGVVQRPKGQEHGGLAHVGPFPVSSSRWLTAEHSELINAVVISYDEQRWENARKQGRYPAHMPSRVWIDVDDKQADTQGA